MLSSSHLHHPYTASFANKSPARPLLLAVAFPYEIVDCPPPLSPHYLARSHLPGLYRGILLSGTAAVQTHSILAIPL